MKFEKKSGSKYTRYKDLKPGTLFHIREDNDIFFKIEDEDAAVHLKTGKLSSFPGNDLVIVVEGKLIWEDK